MSYTKLWATCTHKTSRMMTLCTTSGPVGKYFSEITVEPVLFLYMLSTFSQYALFQDLVYSKVCWSRFPDNPDICHHLHDKYKDELELVQKESSHWILMSTISLVCPSILIAMYLGSWSDKFGRKWPVVIPPLGGVCACLVYIVIAVQPETSVAWICLASFLSGLTGGFVSCIMSCMSFVSAVTTEENRTVRISRMEAMIFLGGTIGPFISGSMLPIIGHAYAFFFMMICYTCAFLYALLFVKDVKDDKVIRDEEGRSGRSSRASGRSRNKSSDTIPSSVAATTLSTSSEEGDNEQKEGLLSASDLHVIETIPVNGDATITDVRNGSCLVDFNLPVQPSAMIDSYEHHVVTTVVEDENEIISKPMVTHAPNHHHNRNSLGSSSGRNSSLHQDDGSSAASDDDQRNIIQRRRYSSVLDGGREGEAESASCCSKYFSSEHCISAVKTVAKKREDGKRTLLIASIFASFVFMVVTAGEMDVAYLFARAEPLNWSYQTYSYYFGFKYGFGALVLVVGMPLFQRLGVEDSTFAILGIISRMAALIMYGLSLNSYMAFSVPLIAVFSVFTIPATRSLLSKLVNPDEQGKMFAFVAMLEDTCTLVASLIFNSVYPLTRPILQGLIFLLAALTLVIPITIMWFVRWRILQIQRRDQASKISRAHLNSVEGAADPATLLCIPKDFEVEESIADKNDTGTEEKESEVVDFSD